MFNDEQKAHVAEAKALLTQAGELVNKAARSVAAAASASDVTSTPSFVRVREEASSLRAMCDFAVKVGELGEQIASYGDRLEPRGEEY